MAGLHRRKFITIISDKFIEHYQGKVGEQDLAEALRELEALVASLDSSKKSGQQQRAETMRKLKKIPLERLQQIIASKA